MDQLVCPPIHTSPNKVFQRLNWNFNWWQYWTLDGLTTDRAFNTNIHTQLNNRCGSTSAARMVSDRRTATGTAPAGVRLSGSSPGFSPWGGHRGRQTQGPGSFDLGQLQPRNDGGRSHYVNLNPQVTVKVATRFSTTLSANYSRNQDDAQWFRNITDDAGVTHYIFAALDQRTLGLTWRLNYTFTPATSFQLYANPFISKGEYRRARELNDPRAAQYDDRFKPDDDPSVLAGQPGFNVKQFRSNAVFRWEYRPGSVLFLVWSQGRQDFDPGHGQQFVPWGLQ